MKRLIILTLILTITACGTGTTTVNIPPVLPPATLPIEPPPEPGDTPIQYSLLVYDSAGVGFSNGTTYSHFMNGSTVPVSPSLFAVNDIIYEVDTFGTVLFETQLPSIPSAVSISGAGSDIWITETIPADYATANGGMLKEYTQVWENYTIRGAWLDRQYTITHSVSTLSGDVIATDTLNRLYSITGAETPHYASQDGIFIHSVDAVARTGIIQTDVDNYSVSWSTNYFNSANQWLEIDGAWYSWNGYKWDAAGLQEQFTALTDFINWTRPVVISAGTRMDASLDRGYWIEANTGWLWMYTPAMDKLEQVVRLYTADGDRIIGAAHAKGMEPIIVSDTLYYTFEGQVWRYDFGSGINGPFVAGKKVRRM